MGGNISGSETSGILKVRVTPRAKKNEITEFLPDGTIKIRLTAPPVDGNANQSLTKLLSTILNIPRSDIEIISGSKGRNKIIRVIGLDQKIMIRRIEQNIA
jgi:uncharacterized protein (TIGR00251 family)